MMDQFQGVVTQGGVIYARTAPHLPEFTATPDGAGWVMAFAWPLRATPAQMAGWNDLYPDCPMDTDTGETRIRMRAGADDLALWAERLGHMVAKCTQWRRDSRQRDEGM